MSPDSTLLIFSDGLMDSIPGAHPENRLLAAVAKSSEQTMANLKSLVDPKYNEDDVTVLLLKYDATRVLGAMPS
jgi:serine phosphatase RsbU (regulator of sigma subunit)